MNGIKTHLPVPSIAVILLVLAAGIADAQPRDPLAKAATWQPPDPAGVKQIARLQQAPIAYTREDPDPRVDIVRKWRSVGRIVDR